MTKNEWMLFLAKETADIKDDIQKILTNLVPSAQQWVTASERLPDIDMSYPHHENYLVQYDSGRMDVISWSNVNRFWTNLVTEPHWNNSPFEKVMAWMPLPEPWKEDNNNET